jgi:hypothetical protein
MGVDKKLVLYTLLHSHHLETIVPNAYVHSLVAGGSILLPLGDDHGLEVLALGHLGLDLLDEAREVGNVLGVLAGGGIAGEL